MIKLINRGKYDKAVQDEFEHLLGRLSAFLGQIFDEDGQYTPPGDGSSSLTPLTPISVRTHSGDIGISSGNLIGYSTLPYPVNLSRAFVVAVYPGVDVRFEPHQTSAGTASLVKGMRFSPTSDINIAYTVVEFLQ